MWSKYVAAIVIAACLASVGYATPGDKTTVGPFNGFANISGSGGTAKASKPVDTWHVIGAAINPGTKTMTISPVTIGGLSQPHFSNYSTNRSAEHASLGSAAYQPTSAFDPAGAAAAVKDTTSKTGVLKGNGSVTSAAINSDLPVMSATVGGAVPTPPNDATKFLNGAGGFTVPNNQTITLSGDATGSGTTGITVAVGKLNGVTVDSAAPSLGDLLRYDGSVWRHVALVSGDIPANSANTSGNAGTASKLASPASINSVPFDGSANINITSAPSAFTVTGAVKAQNAGGTISTKIDTDGVYAVGTDLYILPGTTNKMYLYANGSSKVIIDTAGSANKAVCWKADSKTLGYCSTIVAVDGSCTCN